jgi:hypothetical protein
LGDKRGNWMTIYNNMNLDIRPANIVKGQGLCKMTIESTGIKMMKMNFMKIKTCLEKEFVISYQY